MASPMSFFRRYQRSLMVVFGVTLMVVFLVGMMVPDFSAITAAQRGGTDENAVVVQWKDGKLTRRELDVARIRHFMTLDFLNSLRAYASQKQGEEVVSAAIPLLSIPNPQTSDPADIDDAILSKKLLTQMAREEGIVISDAMVDDYFMLTTNNTALTNAELEKIAAEATNKRMDLRLIRTQLKEELAAQQMQFLYRSGMVFNVSRDPNGQNRFSVNPTEARQLFVRASATVEAEVVPVKVADYLPKVTNEPTNAEIKAIFEKGKYEFADPSGKEPGFKIPRKMNIQYFVFDQEAFLEAEMNKLTDKEIQEEYDRMVKEEDPLVMEIIPEDTETPDVPDGEEMGEATGDTDEAPRPDDPAPQPGAGGEKADGKNADGEKADGEKADGDAAKKEGGDSGKSDGGDPAAEPAKTGDGSGGDAPPAGADNPPASGGGGLTQTETLDPEGVYTAFRSSTGTQDGDPNPPAGGGEPPLTNPPQQEEAKQEEAKQEEAKQEEAKQESATEGDASKTDGDAVTEPALPMQQDDAKPKTRVRPLQDVVDDVKRRLKSAAATEALQKALEAAEFEVRDFQTKYIDWDNATQMGELEKGAALEPFDGASFARKYNLQFASTGLVDPDQLNETELGKARIFTGQQLLDAGPNIFAMYSQLNEYDPTDFRDLLAGKTYMFWAVEKQEQRIPELEEVRDDIVQFWKQQKAFEAAVVDAQKMAEKSNAEKMSLTDMYKEKVINTGEFSWFSSSMNFGFSEPLGVDRPGEEFMETAFSLEQGQAGAAPNMLRDYIYVIRVTKRDQRTDEELNRAFIERVAQFQAIPADVQNVSGNYVNQLNVDWQNEFRNRMKIQWVGR